MTSLKHSFMRQLKELLNLQLNYWKFVRAVLKSSILVILLKFRSVLEMVENWSKYFLNDFFENPLKGIESGRIFKIPQKLDEILFFLQIYKKKSKAARIFLNFSFFKMIKNWSKILKISQNQSKTDRKISN